MTLRIDLTPEEGSRLQQAAKRRGMLVADYARTLLHEGTENDMQAPKRRRKPTRRRDDMVADEAQAGVVIPDSDMPKTGAEILAYWKRHNLLGNFVEGPDSPELARQLRQQAEDRHWDEHKEKRG